MKIKAAKLLFVCVAPLMPLLAHHSFSAEFDGSKAVQLKGVVTKLDWANPHVYFYVDVKDDQGNIVNWGCETGGPGGLRRAGWTRDSMKAGDQVLPLAKATSPQVTPIAFSRTPARQRDQLRLRMAASSLRRQPR